MLPALETSIKALSIDSISEERKALLQPLIAYLQEKLNQNQAIRLHFICTHNSRRSQLAQAWAQTIAAYFGLPISCYSGGVEVTAFHENAVAALEKAGFEVAVVEGENPVFRLRYALDLPPLELFSKKYDDPINPAEGFAAIMTCSQAEENCPYIPGAEKRISITYDDPKVYDGTPMAAAKYEGRSMQIAREMYHIFSRLKS